MDAGRSPDEMDVLEPAAALPASKTEKRPLRTSWFWLMVALEGVTRGDGSDGDAPSTTNRLLRGRVVSATATGDSVISAVVGKIGGSSGFFSRGSSRNDS